MGSIPARLVLVRAPRDAEILWAMEEGLRAAGIVAVVGEVGALADGGEPPAAARRGTLRHHRFSAAALARRGQAARERNLPNAAVTRWRIAALPSSAPPFLPRKSGRVRVGAGDRAPAVAGRAAALPRRRAGMLGEWRWRMRRVMYLWLPRWPIDRLHRVALPEKFRRAG